MTKTKRIILILLSLIGLALSIELCIVYYNSNFALNAAPSICAISDSMNCDSVAKTAYSQFLGVPLSLWGFCLYLFFLFMIFVDKIQNVKFLGFLKVFKNPLSYIFCVSLLSFIISMILGGISIFKINSVCIFCFMTYFVDLLIAITSKTKGISIIEEIQISFKDFIEAIKVKRYAISFIIIVFALMYALTYTSATNILAPQVAKQKELKGGFNIEKLKYDGNRLGDEGATVQIHEYMDFNCQGCFFAQLYLHRIVTEFKNVSVVQHNLPLDSECNPNMKNGGHANSCLKSRYALAAAKQNKYWHLGQALFEPDIKDEKDIIEAARLLDIDIKKLKADANSEGIKQEIKESIAQADEKGIAGTPTLIIGLKKIVGVGTYNEFEQTIIQQGGILKEEYARK